MNLPILDGVTSCSVKCGGACCEEFPGFSKTPQEMGALYTWAQARIISGEDGPWDWETVTIGEMLVRLDEPDEAAPRYTCRHFNTETRLCGIYNERPRMCADYPGYGRGGDCSHCGLRGAIPVERRLSNEAGDWRRDANGGILTA